MHDSCRHCLLCIFWGYAISFNVLEAEDLFYYAYRKLVMFYFIIIIFFESITMCLWLPGKVKGAKQPCLSIKFTLRSRRPETCRSITDWQAERTPLQPPPAFHARLHGGPCRHLENQDTRLLWVITQVPKVLTLLSPEPRFRILFISLFCVF